MSDTASADRSDGQTSLATDRTRPGHSIVLWELRHKKGDLRGLARETSFGIALALEFEQELIALYPKLSVEAVVDHAEHIYTKLIAKGWRPIPDRGGRSEER